MVVGGFKDISEASKIVQQIEDILKVEDRRANVKEVTTFSDPSKVGIIEFTSIPAKIRFYKKMHGVEVKDLVGNKLWFNNNRTFQERVRDGTLDRVKYVIVARKGLELSDVKLMWKSGVVKVKGVKVGSVSDDGVVNLSQEYSGVAEAVRAYMEEWVESRSG